MISALEDLNVDPETARAMVEAKQIASSVREKIDALQRVIRGVINYRSVFNTEMLDRDFRTSLMKVFEKFEIKMSYLQPIDDEMEDVLVCIMALLHDSSFRFYDGNQGNVFLCVYDDFKSTDKLTEEESSLSLYENGVLALYMKYEQGGGANYQPLFISELPISHYISKKAFLMSNISQPMNPIPWICARRSGGILKLQEYR